MNLPSTNVWIVYEDSALREAVLGLCHELEKVSNLTASLWKLNHLEDPILNQCATDELLDSDFIIVAVKSDAKVCEILTPLFRKACWKADHRPAAMAALYEDVPGAAHGVFTKARARLRHLARGMDMQFFSSTPQPALFHHA